MYEINALEIGILIFLIKRIFLKKLNIKKIIYFSILKN
jgi:hypothetical protein